VLAVTVVITVGLLTIAVLGVLCSWVLKARSGLEPDHIPRYDTDAELVGLDLDDAGRGALGN
jgi:hypothetical protein